jgi:hypothetical protein
MSLIGNRMRLAVVAMALGGCLDVGGFEVRAHVWASPPDQLQGMNGARDLSFQFASASEAVASPPILVVTDGAGPHSFPIAFDCAFAHTQEDPVQVHVDARLWRDGTTLALSPYTQSCLYANGIAVYETP